MHLKHNLAMDYLLSEHKVYAGKGKGITVIWKNFNVNEVLLSVEQ